MKLLTEIEPVSRNLDTSTPKSVEELCRELDLSDAARYQRSAQMNSDAFRTNPTNSGTQLLATIQYAYVRWLLGIDDYYTTLPYHLPCRPHRQEASAGWHTPRPSGGQQGRAPVPWRGGAARILRTEDPKPAAH